MRTQCQHQQHGDGENTNGAQTHVMAGQIESGAFGGGPDGGGEAADHRCYSLEFYLTNV